MVGWIGTVAACGLGLSPSKQNAGGAAGRGGSSTSASPTPSTGGGTTTGGISGGASPTPAPAGFQAQYAFIGRFDFSSDPNGPIFAWPQTEIGANFSGTSLTVMLNEPVNQLYNDAPVDNLYDVYVDNDPAIVLAVNHNTTSYPISTTLADTNHTVWVSKRTEANIGEGQFLGIDPGTGGTLLAPPALPTRIIEFIGDSSCSGYGADGNYPEWNGCTFSTETADADVAYPKLTAAAFNARSINLGFAGKGITRDLADGDNNTMPLIYPYIDPLAPSRPYDFSQYTADVVVINIGGNDWTGTSGEGTPPDRATFVADYMGMLQQIRDHYPKSIILVCLTALATDNDRITLREYVQAVQTTASQTMQDVYYFEFPEYDGALGWGCDAHPDAPAHALMAQELEAAIAQYTGW